MKTEALTSSTEINPNQRTWIDNSFDLNNLSVNAVPKSNKKSRKVDNDASRIRKKIRKSPKDESLREKVLKADFQKSIVSSGNEEKTLNHIEFNFNDPVNSSISSSPSLLIRQAPHYEMSPNSVFKTSVNLVNSLVSDQGQSPKLVADHDSMLLFGGSSDFLNQPIHQDSAGSLLFDKEYNMMTRRRHPFYSINSPGLTANYMNEIIDKQCPEAHHLNDFSPEPVSNEVGNMYSRAIMDNFHHFIPPIGPPIGLHHLVNDSSYEPMNNLDNFLNSTLHPSDSSNNIMNKPFKKAKKDRKNDQYDFLLKQVLNLDQNSTSFHCPEVGCGKVFGKYHNLRSHVKTHSSERPFCCSICDASFSRNHDLKRHERIHSGTRPFVCDHCGKSFLRLDALNRHCKVSDGRDCRSRSQKSEDIGDQYENINMYYDNIHF